MVPTFTPLMTEFGRRGSCNAGKAVSANVPNSRLVSISDSSACRCANTRHSVDVIGCEMLLSAAPRGKHPVEGGVTCARTLPRRLSQEFGRRCPASTRRHRPRLSPVPRTGAPRAVPPDVSPVSPVQVARLDRLGRCCHANRDADGHCRHELPGGLRGAAYLKQEKDVQQEPDVLLSDPMCFCRR